MTVRISLAVALVMLYSPEGAAQDRGNDYELQRKAIMVPWNELFGDKVDFSSRRFFTQLLVVGARPLTEFQDFRGKERNDALKGTTDIWMREFFAEEYRLDKEPEKYYLAKGKERSVLYYRWTTADYQMAMFESPSGILLEITSEDGEPIRPDTNYLEQILDAILNVDFTSDDVSSFHLAGTLDEGVAITNAGDFTGLDYGDWRRSIIVFGSNRGLCVLLLKATPGRASMQLPNNPNWLNGLLDTEQ